MVERRKVQCGARVVRRFDSIRKARHKVRKREQPVLAGARSAWRASTEIESQQPPTTRPVTLPAFLTVAPLRHSRVFVSSVPRNPRKQNEFQN